MLKAECHSCPVCTHGKTGNRQLLPANRGERGSFAPKIVRSGRGADHPVARFQSVQPGEAVDGGAGRTVFGGDPALIALRVKVAEQGGQVEAAATRLGPGRKACDLDVADQGAVFLPTPHARRRGCGRRATGRTASR